MNKEIIKSLYEELKGLELNRNLKIVCDWDEVIQVHEPYAMWLAMGKQVKLTDGPNGDETSKDFFAFFEYFWRDRKNCPVFYTPYGSKLTQHKEVKGIAGVEKALLEKQQVAKNSRGFYEEAPFLSIAEDLIKLLDEGKITELVFLSAYDKRKFPLGDDRKIKVFCETFGRYRECSLKLVGFEDDKKGESKSNWILTNMPNVNIVIDDNPIIAGNVQATTDLEDEDRIRVVAPYYPAIEKEHINKEVILIENKVIEGDLKNLKQEREFAEESRKIHGALTDGGEYKEKCLKLLKIKNDEQHLNIILDVMSEREKEVMIRWAITHILCLENHDKDGMFKLLHTYYNELAKIYEQGKK